MNIDRDQAPSASHYLWLAHGLFLLTVYGSLIPLRYQPLPLGQALERFREIPYHDPQRPDARGDWMVNLVQYASVAFCYLAALGIDRGRAFGLAAAVAVVPAGWAVALALEFAQVYFPPRTVSVNDVVVEGLGVVLGAAAWLLCGQRLTEQLRRFWGSRGLAGLAGQALPAYLGLLLVVHLMPFDVVFRPEELADKFREGRVKLVPFGDLGSSPLLLWQNLLKNVLAFLPVGALLALRPGWSGRAVLAAGLGVTALVELLQLLVYTRFCDVTDVVTGTGAILLGWRLVRGLRGGASGGDAAWQALPPWAAPRGWRPWALLALGWAVLLVAINWQPFDFTTDPASFRSADAELSDEDTVVVGLRRMTWAPFADYYWGSRYQALDQIVRRSLSFAPLGVLLALACGRRERLGALATVLAALALAVLIEGGQYLLPERHPSVTDLLIHTLGAWLGYALTRHAAHALTAAPAGTALVRSGADLRFETAALRLRPGHGPPRARLGPGPSYPPPDRGKKTLLDQFDALPFWARVTVLCVAAVVLPLGVVLLLGTLGR